jgi:hypothetical protein
MHLARLRIGTEKSWQSFDQSKQFWQWAKNPSWPSPPVNHPSDPVPILFPEMPVKEDSEVRLRVRQKNFKQVN